MKKIFERLFELKGAQNTASFARSIGLNQQTMDRYLKGREPPIGVVEQLCLVYGVSADWLLGIPDRGTSATTITGNTGSIAIGHGAKANCTRLAPDCTTCKYKVFAEAFKAIQTPS